MMTDRLTCVVAEDEPFVRKRIVRLAEAEGLEVVAAVGDGHAALAEIAARRPAIALLDIRMPGLDGLALADAISGIDEPPVVIFVTAFAQHALAAFELSAIDYVVKPVEVQRFQVAARRARETALARGARRTLESVRSVLRGDRPTRIILRSGSSRLSIAPSDIVRFVAADDYVEAHLPSSVHLLSVRLDALERALETPPFVRVHRSHIVNIDRVAELLQKAGRWSLVMDDGSKVPVARNRTKDLSTAMQLVGCRKSKA